MSLYFILLTASVGVPLVLSFDKRLRFYTKWKYVLPSITAVALVYILFDILLTKNGVWGFNPKYLSGKYIFNLPVEECLFFIAIPYASIFLHYSVIEYFPNLRISPGRERLITFTLISVSLAILIFTFNNQYTLYILLKFVIVLFLSYFDKNKTINTFYFTFLFILVPFVIVNGILTGSFIDEEVIWYNNAENLGIRFFTIPVEDFAYAFSMILFNLLLIENLEKTGGKK